ncbi:MAG: FHA domain-containing protein [Myxococcota bacterium]
MAELILLRRGEEMLRTHLEGDLTRIGRGIRNDLVFPEHERHISRDQLQIERRAGGFWFEDRSGEGVLLNGIRAFEGVLRDEDRFHLGQWELCFREVDEDSASDLISTRGGTTQPLEDFSVMERAGKVRQWVLSFLWNDQIREFEIPSHGLSVGSSQENALVLSLPFVSGFHCRLFWRDGRLSVRDMGSSNGTFVNGRRSPCRSC